VEVQLRKGERFRGLLAFSNDEILALEVEGHLLELRRREVVSERYLDRDSTWIAAAKSASGLLGFERIPLGEGGLLAAARQAFADQAQVLFLPSRAPSAWAQLPEGADSRGPFPLWDPIPALPLECVPHLVALGSEGEEYPWAAALLGELGPGDLVLLEAMASPLALSGFLGQLRWAYVGGRALGLRFYDPRVLGDLWENLDPGNLGLVFGGAWTRDERGQEDLRCVLCDGTLAALSLRCSGCGAPLLGNEEAPFLLGAQARVEGEDLVVARPQVGIGARRSLARPLSKGRKALWLEPAVVKALGGAYRKRIEGGEGSEPGSGGAMVGAKT